MSSLQERKLRQLYEFYLKNGFSSSAEEIAEALGISQRTIFNRYKTLENLKKEVLNYWRFSFYERIEARLPLCNNDVEKLLYFIYELKRSSRNEPDFFRIESNTGGFLQNNPGSFIEMTTKILEKGISNASFEIGYDLETFAIYLLFNIIYLYILQKQDTTIILFLLLPILTDAGKEEIESLDLNDFLE